MRGFSIDGCLRPCDDRLCARAAIGWARALGDFLEHRKGSGFPGDESSQDRDRDSEK